jgi:hypothetical protein
MLVIFFGAEIAGLNKYIPWEITRSNVGVPLIELSIIVKLTELMDHQEGLREVSVIDTPVNTGVIEFVIERTLVIEMQT